MILRRVIYICDQETNFNREEIPDDYIAISYLLSVSEAMSDRLVSEAMSDRLISFLSCDTSEASSDSKVNCLHCSCSCSCSDGTMIRVTPHP